MSVEPDSSQRVWEGQLIGVTIERWGEHEREIVEHPGAVAIVAVDGDGYLTLVRKPVKSRLRLRAGSCRRSAG